MARTKEQLMNQALGLRPEAVRFPRTPETEALEDYGYRDVAKALGKRLGRRSSGSAQELSERLFQKEGSLEEAALAGLGGMVKTVGMTKLLPEALQILNKFRRLKEPQTIERMRKAWLETLKIPEKEWKPLKDIGWHAGEDISERGAYWPREKMITFNPTAVVRTTPAHEFSHVRQWAPQGKKEKQELDFLYRAQSRLYDVYDQNQFYYQKDPMEQIARDVPDYMARGFPFNDAYRQAVDNAITKIEQGSDFSPALVEQMWKATLQKSSAGKEHFIRSFDKTFPSTGEALKAEKKFSSLGLKHDTFAEPLPGMGYHQWTFYGEGPLKGATVGTKGTSMKEVSEMVGDRLKKFGKGGK